MIYNFKCFLKGQWFPYKIEADNVTDAMIRVREHIKNAVELHLVEKSQPEPPINKATGDFFSMWNEITKPK